MKSVRALFTSALLCVGLVFAGCATTLSHRPEVTTVTLTPATKVYSGDCPVRIVFSGSITVNAPTTVRYVYTRSDGATDTVTKELKFRARGTQSIRTTWTLGGESLPAFKGWQAVKVLGPTAIESAHADFEVHCDPKLNSARAAHGNTDWHIDTANEFLFGKDMDGNNTAPNFAPSGWTKSHIHVGLSNTAHFYDDEARVGAADDADIANGIDKPMLFFYAGHGNPTTWNTLGNNGHQTDVLLGNRDGGGQLRYYWQCSCEVFAHGPRVCDNGDCDYSEPENFDGSADSAAMRNVFERWGPAIGSDLRMACGVSTLAYCHEGNVNSIWNRINNEGRSVAEAFILGLGSASVKPLCITRGGPDITKTPLYDQTFTNRPNTSGSGYLHILYEGGTQTDPPVILWTPEMIPHKLWRVHMVPAGDPVELRRRLVKEQQIERLSDPQLAGGAAIIHRHPESGALTLKAVGREALKVPRSAKGTQLQRNTALEFARRIGWMGEDAGPVQVTPLLTASMPTGGARGARGRMERGEKGVVVSIRRRVRNGNHTLDVIGNGGRAVITLSSGGEVLSAARTWRRAQVAHEEITIKTFERAESEAMRRLERADQYKLADWRFGYKEAAATVAQSELPVVYEFDFVPKDREKLIDYPPRRIEVSAEMP